MNPHIDRLCDEGGFIDRPTFDPWNCSVWITIEIGFEAGSGADRFHLQVATKQYLKSCNKPQWGKSMLIVERFGWDEIEKSVGDLLSGISTDNWEDAAKTLSRYMDWEFDGM